jgi:hypothetical protein
MKMLRSAVLFTAACAASWPATARAQSQLYPIAQALSSPDAQAKLDRGVKLYFGRQGHPPVARTIGVWPSNKRANKFGRSEQQACDYALLSAVLSLQGRARRERANAVIDIVTSYGDAVTVSAAQYVCDTAGLRVGVVLRGRVVSLGR